MKRRVALGHLNHCSAIKELGNADIFQQSLSPSSFDHELSGKVRYGAWLKRSQNDRLVEWISWDHVPMRELGEYHCLTHRVSPEIRFEAKRLDCRDLNLQGVERRAWLGLFEDNMSSSSQEDVVYSVNCIMRAIDLCLVNRFHDSWGCEQE